jgi:AcrR family transcriptional regulator
MVLRILNTNSMKTRNIIKVSKVFKFYFCAVMEMSAIAHESNDQVEKVLSKAGEMFLSIGIRAVTLDDIAKELGMSKKTIYTFFENKGAIIFQIVQSDILRKQEVVLSITNQHHDPITEMILIGKEVIDSLQTFSINIVSDLMKFYPEAWQLVEQHKQDFVYSVMLNNHRKGKATGLYRQDLNDDMTTRLIISFTDSIINPQGLLKTGMPIANIYKEYLLYHLYSICSEKGRGRLEELLKTIELS